MPLQSVFDTNNDGKLTAADDDFASFKVMVTQADGSLVAKTLAELNIIEINLIGDATQIELPDGSVITGTTTYVHEDPNTQVQTARAVAIKWEIHYSPFYNSYGPYVSL
ncbi:MAG: hypothetical protein JKY00_12390 [Roseicyclus sp.]|nr:hypothetical protein [Roseicyclus sp.]